MAIDKPHPSPEERLLKLLRVNPSNRQSQRPAADKKEYKFKMPQFFSTNIIKKTNIFLLFVLVCSFVYLLFKLFIPSDYKNRLEKLKLTEPDAIESRQLSIPQPKPIDFEMFRRNDLFVLSYNDRQGAQATTSNHDVLSGLILMGIISGENPQAIIEDKKANKTYFLFKGERFQDFKVKDILDGKVIIITGAQEEFELKL